MSRPSWPTSHPRRDVSVEEVIHHMQLRHTKRQAAIDYTYEKQRRELTG